MPKQLILSFSLFVSFCAGPIWPLSCTRCAFPWSRSPSTLPFIFTPLPPAMNDSLGEAPFLHQKKLCNHTLQPSLHFSDLTMLCNAWKTLAFLVLVFFFFLCFFFHALSLALSLSYIQYWLFMLFNVVERARGLRMGEKRSSWHTYAPVVNSSSQHSSKYTDLLLFPLPPSLSLSLPLSFYNWELLWTSAPRVAPLQRSPYGRLRCSNAQAKYLHNNPPFASKPRRWSWVEWSQGGVRGRQRVQQSPLSRGGLGQTWQGTKVISPSLGPPCVFHLSAHLQIPFWLILSFKHLLYQSMGWNLCSPAVMRKDYRRWCLIWTCGLK